MSIRPLPPKLQKTAKEELNEDSERLTEDLRHIQEWIDKQPHLNARKGNSLNSDLDRKAFNLLCLFKILNFC